MGIIFSLIGAVASVGSYALTAAGFTPSGIAAGSIAASVQSTIGNVAAGSAFAGLQSLGASGTLVSSGAIGAGVAVAGVALGETSSSREEEDVDDAIEENGTNFFTGSLDFLKPTKASNSFCAEPMAKLN